MAPTWDSRRGICNIRIIKENLDFEPNNNNFNEEEEECL